jgi:hypothetical protein
MIMDTREIFNHNEHIFCSLPHEFWHSLLEMPDRSVVDYVSQSFAYHGYKPVVYGPNSENGKLYSVGFDRYKEGNVRALYPQAAVVRVEVGSPQRHREGVLRVMNGDVVALDVAKHSIDVRHTVRGCNGNPSVLTELVKFCNVLAEAVGLLDLFAPQGLCEVVKNALTHGNKGDIRLPIYLHYNQADQVLSVIDTAARANIGDLNNMKNYGKLFHGEHAGLILARNTLGIQVEEVENLTRVTIVSKTGDRR